MEVRDKESANKSEPPVPLRQDYRRALGRVAHDIRSATGVAWTALAEIERGSHRDDGAPSGIESFLKIGQRSLRRLLLLADRLTLAGAIEEGALELTRCETSVSELLQSIVNDVSFALGRRSVEVTLESIPPALTVSADGRWLGAAFAELIGNAIRFAKSKVRISAEEDGGQIKLTISDDGAGLPPAAAASLTDGCPSPEGSHGLGLSLPLANRVIAAHGGYIRIDPREPGTGTTLLIYMSRPSRSPSP